MSEKFPYPECEGCYYLVDDDCKGIIHWLLCGYLVRELIDNFKVPMPEMEKAPSHLAVKGGKEK